jgi:hypothetical protein
LEWLGPYESIMLLAVHLIVVEPLRVVALITIAGRKWVVGSGMLVAVYGASVLGVEKLFKIVKPSLLSLGWFSNLWGLFVQCRGSTFKVLASVGSSKFPFRMAEILFRRIGRNRFSICSHVASRVRRNQGSTNLVLGLFAEKIFTANGWRFK